MNDDSPDIVYIHPAKQPVGFPFADPRLAYLTPFTLFPMGVIGLMNLACQEGLTVRGLNYPAQSFVQPGFDLPAWLRTIGHPRLFLIDLHWYEHSYGALDVAETCKRIHPHTPILVGGLMASQFSREILEAHSCVDYVIRGDAEEPLQRLLRAISEGSVDATALDSISNLSHRDERGVVENPLTYHTTPKELDSLDLVNIDWLDHADRYLGMQYVGRRGPFYADVAPNETAHWLSIGRGCCYNCGFCGGGNESHRAISGRQRVLLRSPGRVVADLEQLCALGVDQVALSLDPSIMGEEYWQPLMQEIAERSLRIGLYLEAFQLPSLDFLSAFAEVVDMRHSQIALSLISGDERVRRLNGKMYSNEELVTAIRQLKQHKVPLAVYYSFNLPGQNETSLRRTMHLTRRLGYLYPAHLLMVYNQPHTLDPCSPMSLHPDKYGVNVELRTFQDYYDYCRLTAVEKQGVLGSGHRGFTWRGRTSADEQKMIAMWRDFASQQSFLCF